MQTSSRKKNISTVIILVIVLLVPGFLYIMMNKLGSNEYVKLPVYGEKSLSGKMNRKMGRSIPDTTFHQLDILKLINDRGDSVQFLGQDSLVYVVHLFYTKDDALSHAMAMHLRPVVERFKNNSKVKFYSLSVDPLDIPADLSSFAKQYNKGLEANWNFVSRPSIDILQYAQEKMLLNAIRDPQDSSRYLISNNYILIDSKRRIRGFYDINLKPEMDRLQDEIKVQLVEEIRNNPLKINQK